MRIKGSWAHAFRNSIVEGIVYYIKNFAVVDNKNRYRVVGDNKVMIQLYANSTVKRLPDDTSNIPMHRFDLLPFDMVETRMNQEYILTDVVGHICSEGKIEEKHIHNRMVPCLMLELQDRR
ncbi:unnamed protein product [Cuscuta campestris]|uniref:DUF223 domain-containing protein n=2 Tax=Cuscuta campestris TaxID=132261 RepID=A0A484KEN7_9ASTE|nr:unnamed protein product [Cuscuta campestris]